LMLRARMSSTAAQPAAAAARGCKRIMRVVRTCAHIAVADRHTTGWADKVQT
jgi:hypothetical protein